VTYGTVPGIPGKVSRLVQGSVMLKPESREENFALLDAVYDAGIKAFDSSHIYGMGAADKVLGAWVRSRGVRGEIVMHDKCCHPIEGRKRVSARHIAEDLRTCLDNLGFDRIDIFTFHRDDPEVDVAELVEAMNEHIRAGTIRAYGCSNWTVERYLEGVGYAKSKGLVPFAVSSPHFSLAVAHDAPWAGCLSITGAAGRAEYERYLREQSCLFCWSSLSSGFFSGLYSRENLERHKEGQPALVKRCYCREDNFRRMDRVKVLAAEKGRSTSRIALAYVLSSPLRAFPLVACWRPEEAYDNAAACDLRLTEAERAWLDLSSDSRPAS
jgi:aryl-alcohol dehydrogenase-like predicted oxidoreductase